MRSLLALASRGKSHDGDDGDEPFELASMCFAPITGTNEVFVETQVGPLLGDGSIIQIDAQGQFHLVGRCWIA